MKTCKAVLTVPLAIMLLAAIPAYTQRGRDPLTSSEINQLRDSKQEPDKRLKLFVQFAKARMDELEKVSSDPRLGIGRGGKMHDLIQDLGTIVDEMDDNVEMYAQDKWDIRKALKEVVEAETQFQQKLGAIKAAAANNPSLSEDVKFVLQDTLESIEGSLEDAQSTLRDQETLAQNKQLRKPE